MIYPTRPPACKVAAQWLGLARAFEGVTTAFFEKAVQFFQQFGVTFLPMEILIPGPFGKNQIHGWMSSRFLPLPASSSSMLANNSFALAGERNRYSVSSMAVHSLADINTAPSPRWRVMAIGARSATTLSITDFRFSRASE
jgi:hypothetical protein